LEGSHEVFIHITPVSLLASEPLAAHRLCIFYPQISCANTTSVVGITTASMARAIVARQDPATASAICQVDCHGPHDPTPEYACLGSDLSLSSLSNCSSDTDNTVSFCFATSTQGHILSCLSTVVPEKCGSTPCASAPLNTQSAGLTTATLPSSAGSTTVVASTVNGVQSVGTSNAESPSQSSRSNGLSSSAAAGIAIGSALLGAVCAGLIFFFYARRKHRRTSGNQKQIQATAGYAHNHLGFAGEGKQATDVASSVKVTAVSAGFEEYLPQPAEDGKITTAMSQLRDRIKNHAQSYYHTELVQPGMLDMGAIQQLAQTTKLPAARLQEALLNPRSRVAMIRLYLSWVVLSRCSMAADVRDSLLPPEVALFAAQLGDHDFSDGQLCH
jgi:hypothetical protein